MDFYAGTILWPCSDLWLCTELPLTPEGVQQYVSIKDYMFRITYGYKKHSPLPPIWVCLYHGMILQWQFAINVSIEHLFGGKDLIVLV